MKWRWKISSNASVSHSNLSELHLKCFTITLKGHLVRRKHESGLRVVSNRSVEQVRTLTLNAEPHMTDVFSIALTGIDGPLTVISLLDGEGLIVGDVISLF